MTDCATMPRCLKRICEAVARLGDRAETLMPSHPWHDIRGMGNRLRHAYDRIDSTIVWSIVSNRLPAQKADAPKHWTGWTIQGTLRQTPDYPRRTNGRLQGEARP